MTDLKTEVVGTYGIIEGDAQKRSAAMGYVDKIRPVVQRQLSLRGSDKPFKFKAFGYIWLYKPKER